MVSAYPCRPSGMNWSGISVWQVVFAILVLAVAIFARVTLRDLMLGRIRAWSARSENPIEDIFIQALARPLCFLPIVATALAIGSFLTTPAWLAGILPQVNRTLVAFTLFWAFWDLAPPAFSTLRKSDDVSGEALVIWAAKMAKVLIIFLGCAVILEIWGIRIWPILAGFGLVGAALALGAKDLFKDLIAGIFIIGELRCQEGDWVCVDGVVEGTVETIGLRTTRIRRFDTAPVFVPNSMLADEAMTNFSGMKHRRISWVLSLEYGATIDQLRQIRDGIAQHIQGNDDFARPPASVAVRIDGFSESSIDMMVHCFAETTDWAQWLEVKEKLAFSIKDIVEKAGARFALPSRALYIDTTPSDMELFPLQPNVKDAQPSGKSGVGAMKAGPKRA